MRDVDITQECLDFIESNNPKLFKKFGYLLQVITTTRVIHSSFIKKLVDTPFYELRIKIGDQYRIIVFSLDHDNFNECTKAVLLYGFHKKSTKDYKDAIKKSQQILEEYLINKKD